MSKNIFLRIVGMYETIAQTVGEISNQENDFFW